MRNFPTLARTRSRLFAGGLAPPVTTSQVAGLPFADAAVYFDPIGFVAADGYQLETLRSRQLEQAALSNYQFATKVGSLMFFAGVVAAVPEQGKIIHGPRDLPAEIRLAEPPLSPAARAFRAPLRAQTAFVYDLFDRFLREQGARLDDLVKLNIYLRDVGATDVVEEVAAQLAPSAHPAVALYGVESLATRFFLVEIEGIAADPAGAWEKETLAALDDPHRSHHCARAPRPRHPSGTVRFHLDVDRAGGANRRGLGRPSRLARQRTPRRRGRHRAAAA